MPRRGRGTLERRVGSREPKKRVIVVCEGAKTEPDYLRQLSRLTKTALVQLEIVDSAHTAPKQLVEVACDEVKSLAREAKRSRDKVARNDEVWCVFDVDQHPLIPEALQQAEANGVHVALSNPCIELWFLLHFTDHTSYLERDAARRKLTTELGQYSKGAFDLRPFIGKYQEARDRAVRLDTKHRDDESTFPDNNPSSGVWRLVETLQAAY
jgi:hypothetical protein